MIIIHTSLQNMPWSYDDHVINYDHAKETWSPCVIMVRSWPCFLTWSWYNHGIFFKRGFPKKLYKLHANVKWPIFSNAPFLQGTSFTRCHFPDWRKWNSSLKGYDGDIKVIFLRTFFSCFKTRPTFNILTQFINILALSKAFNWRI